MLRAILAAVRAAAAAVKDGFFAFVDWTWRTAVWTANLPLRFVADVAGVGTGVPPTPAAPRGEGEDADAAVDRVNEALERVGRARIGSAAMAATIDPRLPAGRVAHHYAIADTYERDEVDLSSLQPEQLGWLVTLTEAELTCLAAAGPDVCERHLAGEATSLGDKVPAVGPGRGTDVGEDEVQEDLTFADRLKRFKADTSPVPHWA